ncbi:hypothetical protein [Jhaorihella thermophila]|uniref:Chemotaxis protein CheA n=1 Tax=Jhaorihella thermophila TaxID=488547 RepID=A0A1H5V766_9RHOB|nr:hypothetical protein [Jhaorihella thermophila]SEF83044.1 hypothetical protein SAMN05421751_105194 [Jhaorihella thermophila]
MVQNNKILTVSYGTFSCTLEGFEDSFETMKAIAEYFRDLAREDRYFGAEPPQPDAEMLARIAEREIARQVEARHEESGIVLTAAAPEATTPPAAPAMAEATDAPSAADAAVAEAAPEPAPEPAQPHAHADAAESAAVSEPPIIEEPAEVSAEEVQEDAEAAPEPSGETARPPAVEEPAEPASEAEPEMATAEDLGQPAPARPQAEDSIAAKLERIRAVVARNEQAETDQYDEDALADSAAPAEITSTLAHVLHAEDTEEEAEAAEPLTWEAFAEPAAAEAPAAAPTVEEGADEAAEPVEEAAGKDDSDIGPDESEEDLTGADSLFGDLDQETDEAEPDDQDVANILSEAEEEPAASVIKIKKRDLDEAVEAAELEEIVEDAAPSDHGDLPPEDEAELIQELAQLEAEITGADQAPAAEEYEPARPAGKGPAGTPDVERLMKSAEERLSDPEAAARHEAYTHMRAAVATTRAEREAGGTMGTHPSDDPYRVDLAHAVRPRRPDAPRTRPVRPTTKTRAAPLKLVAEQRVDEGAGRAARGPIRPRRVAAELLDDSVMAAVPSGESEFARFARELGAEELPELLEAAAAYLAFVEGRTEFSRPQLMNVARQVRNADFNREDGLRAFGHLLREGKIEKKGGGRFTVSGDIGFRPGQRATG